MLYYTKIKDVKSPTRAHSTDAGVDFYIPNDFESVEMGIGDSILIGSGIKVKLPTGTVGLFCNKSSIAKKGLVVGAQVVDEQYSGEIYIQLIKITGEKIKLNPGDKVVQMLIMPIKYDKLKEISIEQYNNNTRCFERKDGAFGSTNDI